MRRRPRRYTARPAASARRSPTLRMWMRGARRRPSQRRDRRERRHRVAQRRSASSCAAATAQRCAHLALMLLHNHAGLGRAGQGRAGQDRVGLRQGCREFSPRYSRTLQSATLACWAAGYRGSTAGASTQQQTLLDRTKARTCRSRTKPTGSPSSWAVNAQQSCSHGSR